MGERRARRKERKAAKAPRRRLSFLRITGALVVVAGAGTGGTVLVQQALEPEPDTTAQWFAPYVDVTLPPFFDFQDPTVNPVQDVILSFVVGGGEDGCEPTWGGRFDLDEAARDLDLDRRIARMRLRGGDVIVSFGGVANEELAVSCDDPDALLDAYQDVIERYEVTVVDFDVEGDALRETAASRRRAEAVAALQADAIADGRDLDVWLTVPVAPSGMPEEAVGLLDETLAGGVDLAGVNVMTMNYGPSRESGIGMVDASTAALDATFRQLRGAYDRSGTRLAPEALWGRIGMTPMIGQNDYTTDRLTTGEARDLLDAARERGVSRISMWSLNRDQRCGANVDPAVSNNYCSGVDQDALAFSELFDSVDGRPTSVSVPDVAYDPQDIPIDDPATSPYPIWRERTEYDEGERVVWRGDVYEAKWWNVTEPPDAPVVNEWESPWRLLGPVLPEERAHPTTTTTIPDDTYPEWVRTDVYEEGDRVQHDGVGYEAKWWTSGDVPGADVDNDWETPWEVVGPPDED